MIADHEAHRIQIPLEVSEMSAAMGLDTRRPAQVAVAFVVLAFALLLAGALGYALRSATPALGPTRVIVVSTPLGGSNPQDDSCIRINGHKAC